MLDIGWSEMLIVAVVALLVIGPKDLPKMLHTIGRYAGKVRAIAREFQDSIDDAVRETELAEVKKQLDNAGNFDLKKTVTEAVDPDGKIAEATDMSALNKKFSFGGTPPKEEAELEAEVAAEVAEEDAPAAIETQVGEAAEPAPEHAVEKPEPDPDPDLDPEPPRAPASLAAGAVAAAEALNKAKAAEAAAQAETAAQADATEPKPESTGA
ncbi:MAG: Sec-independent protein translocase protein TatB [Alphaproteobacteria bacterium]|nr:Sec-independent protein translocase protein TatB [Alphaproteobacteria bacterium]